MIWDRFDDAMDDVSDEELDVLDQVRDLERQLRDLGEPLPTDPPWEPVPTYETDSPADRAYREAFHELAHHRARRDRLVELVAEARNRRHAKDGWDYSGVPPRVWAWQTASTTWQEAHVGSDGVRFRVDDSTGEHGAGWLNFHAFLAGPPPRALREMPEEVQREIGEHVLAYRRPKT